MEQAALLSAIQVLAAAASPSTLKAILHQLVDDPAPETPDTTKPPVSADGDAGQNSLGSLRASAAPRTTRGTSSAAKPTRQGSSTANGSASRLTGPQWLLLREKVEAEMRQQGLDLAQLATATGYSIATIRNIMRKRSPPSVAITAKLREFVGSGSGGARSGSGPGPQQTSNGSAGSGNTGIDGQELAARLRAKRRPLPLTSTTLAGQIGVQPDELDDALHGRPVPLQAAERLSAWATG